MTFWNIRSAVIHIWNKSDVRVVYAWGGGGGARMRVRLTASRVIMTAIQVVIVIRQQLFL